MTDPPPHDSESEPWDLLLAALPFWVALAAAAQLVYVAHWPMLLLGTPVPRVAALGVAFVRMGVYAGLAAGLAAREPAAWAGVLLELARSFLLFAAHLALSGWTVPGAVYPAGWAQGLLSAALPFVVLVNAALAGGWRPGPGLAVRMSLLARILGGLAGISALALRRKARPFRIAKEERLRVLLRDGLPVPLLLTAAEGLAFYLALKG